MAEVLFDRFPGHRVEVLGGEVAVEPLPDGRHVVRRPGQVVGLPGTTVTLPVSELVA
ncbi:hypothetical protein [Kitasatospora xanthocidica]|nr:hypothetical protein [Kitasatospora xanthocidica]